MDASAKRQGMDADSSFRIGLFYPNAPSIHVHSEVVSKLNPDVRDLEVHKELAATAESVGFDYLFIADTWGPFGPEATRCGYLDPALFAPILAPALMSATEHIGVITTMHTSWFTPALLARVGANLDALSNGRWGVNVVTGSGFNDELIESMEGPIDHDARYEAADEAIEIATALWADGQVDFKGKYHQARGRLVGPSTVQKPRPMIVSAGASTAGQAFAARHADYIFMPGRAPKQMVAERIAAIREKAAASGRSAAQDIRFLMHATVVLRRDRDEADFVNRWLEESVDLPMTKEYLLGIKAITTYDEVYDRYTEDDLRDIGAGGGSLRISGGPDEVAEALVEMRNDFGCDGVSISLPLWHPIEVARFGKLVLPQLEAAGVRVHPSDRGWGW